MVRDPSAPAFNVSRDPLGQLRRPNKYPQSKSHGISLTAILLVVYVRVVPGSWYRLQARTKT